MERSPVAPHASSQQAIAGHRAQRAPQSPVGGWDGRGAPPRAARAAVPAHSDLVFARRSLGSSGGPGGAWGGAGGEFRAAHYRAARGQADDDTAR